MPTLLQICVEGNTGSTGRIAEGIGIAALNRGWKSYIAYGRFPRPSKSSLIRIGSTLDVAAHGLLTRIFDRHCLASANATRELVNNIRDLQPDIIHLHHLHGYYINIKILFEYLSKAPIPIVWTFHDCWSITGHCAHFELIGCEKWKSECHHCPQKREYPASFLVDRSRNNFRLKKNLFTSIGNMTIVPASKWLNEIIEESFLAQYPRAVIYNGVDLSVFGPTNQKPEITDKIGANNRFIILGVANIWTRAKGLQDFVRLSSILNEDEIIVLVGLSKTQIRKLPKNIVGLEKTKSPRQLGELYSAAGVYLNPTWEDNFPSTNIEALACGTPIVTYNTGGSIEAVAKGTGFIIEKGDVAGLYRAVKIIRAIGGDRYSTACRERAVMLFNKDDRYNQYIDLYKGLARVQA
jgi:putative colanic acid biosynthesis glycosyltransferase